MTCLQCSTEFTARRSTARFCKAKCRVKFNREKHRKAAFEQSAGSCIAAPVVASDDAETGFEVVDLGAPDYGPCEGHLLLCGERALVCRRHKGVLGEEKFKSKFDREHYEAIRQQQGREHAGNQHFKTNVGGFMRGYRRPEKLGAKSSWRGPYRKPQTLEDMRGAWDGGDSF